MEVEITNITEISQFSADGRLKPIIQVTFRIGTFGPFSVQIPKEDFSQVRVAQEIEKIRREVAAIAGK